MSAFVCVWSTGLGDGEVAAASSAAVRTPAVRAAELAAVSLRLYEAGGKAIHVPLPPDHGLIVILREVLGTAGSSSAAVPSTKELKEMAQLREGAAQVAQALLEMILQQHQQVCHVHAGACSCSAHLPPDLRHKTGDGCWQRRKSDYRASALV